MALVFIATTSVSLHPDYRFSSSCAWGFLKQTAQAAKVTRPNLQAYHSHSSTQASLSGCYNISAVPRTTAGAAHPERNCGLATSPVRLPTLGHASTQLPRSFPQRLAARCDPNVPIHLRLHLICTPLSHITPISPLSQSPHCPTLPRHTSGALPLP